MGECENGAEIWETPSRWILRGEEGGRGEMVVFFCFYVLNVIMMKSLFAECMKSLLAYVHLNFFALFGRVIV